MKKSILFAILFFGLVGVVGAQDLAPSHLPSLPDVGPVPSHAPTNACTKTVCMEVNTITGKCKRTSVVPCTGFGSNTGVSSVDVGSGSSNPAAPSVGQGSSNPVISPTTSTEIPNPLNCKDIPCIANTILSRLPILAAPFVGIFVIYAGFLFVTAGGSEDRIKQARSTLLYTVIGYGLILIAASIGTLVNNILNGQ